VSGITGTCVNCGGRIRGEMIGLLADGPLYDWRHDGGPGRRGRGCGGNHHADASTAIPAAEATHECPVHRSVTRYHSCPATYSPRLRDRARVRTADGRTGQVSGERYVDGTVEVLWALNSRPGPDDFAARVPEADLELLSRSA
jgi:hypothetical protein